MPKETKILIVEPENEVGTMLKAVFEHAGFDAVCATDSTEALHQIERDEFGFALVEVILPRLNGLKLADELARRGIPLLMMTGHPIGMAILNRHDYPCLYKPFRLNALLASVGEIMAAHCGGTAFAANEGTPARSRWLH